ncbi:CHAT domain-containing protein [Nonomuraea rhodomycinica]|uniref:CHAT domain-containing protein n=1 Tax=Nonomuraea rhodomycinica TaxID=1712872 RepID=A0A7Y6M9D2_9ACTN|nr:CHAT domain-containing protein [Nonomuraea rhodomycinica]NUW40068.1 CHAT domain-containing protein [Nonomuraea rhodomycinica]
MLRRSRAVRAARRAAWVIREYPSTHDLEQLDEALETLRNALEHVPERHPERAEWLSALGDGLSMRFDHIGKMEDIAESLTVHRTAVRLAEGTDAGMTAELSRATALLNTYELHRPDRSMAAENRRVLDEVVAILREVSGSPGLDPELRDSATVNLVLALEEQAELHPERLREFQDETHAILTRLVRATSPDHTYYLSRVVKLAMLLVQRWDLPERDRHLRELLEVVRRRFPTATEIDRRSIRAGLGWVLDHGIDVSERVVTVDRLVAHFREQMTLLPEEHALRTEHLVRIAYYASIVAMTSGRLTLLDEVIAAMRATLAGLPGGHPAYAELLSALGTAMGRRMQATSTTTDLKATQDLLEAGIARLPEGDPERGLFLANLANTYAIAYQITGREEHLTECLRLCREGVALTPPDHPNRGMALTGLGIALHHAYERWRRRQDIDGAIEAHREAVRATPDHHYDAALYRANLGGSLIARFEDLGLEQDLDDAIEALRACIRLTPREHSLRGTYLSNLGSALFQRYVQYDDTAALEEARLVLRESVASVPQETPDGGLATRNLANALMVHDRAAASGDAVELLRAGLARLGDTHVSRAGMMASLGLALIAQTEAVLVTERQRKITHLIQGLARGEIPLPVDADALAALVHEVRDGPRPAHVIDDLDEAVDMLRGAVAAGPVTHAEYPMWLSALGVGLSLRAKATGEPAPYAEAVRLLRETLELTLPGQPRRASVLNELALLLDRWADDEPGEAERLRGQAIEALRESAAVEAAPAGSRAGAARFWGRLAADQGDFALAVQGFGVMVGLLEAMAWRGLSRGDQERLLADFQGTAGDAAACALETGDARLAVELLEQGRGVLLAQALDARAARDRLARELPDLAARLTEVYADLDDQSADMDRRHAAARRHAALVAEIRRQPGFEDFERSMDFTRLAGAAADGPVVVLNVSRYRCDALVVAGGDVTVVPLPDVSADAVEGRVAGFTEAIEALGGGAREFDDLLTARQTVQETLSWVWDTITEPVLDRLPGARRVWWCPTGPAVFLPLHASGDHRTRHDARPRTVMDRVVSSYTPTVRALAHVRSLPPPVSRPDGQPLVVSMPTTPGAADLPGAAREEEIFRECFPGARTLRGASATREAVVTVLRASPWVHFACHGAQDTASPFHAWLALQDGPLTVRDLAALDLSDHALLAFLSGCDTSRGDERLSDEAITLSSAVHLAGYRHVIGAQWQLEDSTAPHVAARVYRRLGDGRGGLDAAGTAAALHEAVLELRERMPYAPLVWALFTHTGP